jgi:hypothetical protein
MRIVRSPMPIPRYCDRLHLPKRTTLYTSYARIANDGAASLQTPGTLGGVDKQLNAGINHIF